MRTNLTVTRILKSLFFLLFKRFVHKELVPSRVGVEVELLVLIMLNLIQMR